MPENTETTSGTFVQNMARIFLQIKTDVADGIIISSNTTVSQKLQLLHQVSESNST